MKLKKITKKKAQMEFSIAVLFFVIVGLVIIAPFVLKIYNSFVTPFGSAVGNITEQAGTNVAHIKNTFIGFWDFVIVFAFLVNIILLFLSAFLVRAYPFFLIVYIVFGILLFIFAPEVGDVLDKIYDSSELGLEVSQLAMVDFLREYLMIVLLAIYFVTGVILYARIRSPNPT